jgi:hypothetical protein
MRRALADDEGDTPPPPPSAVLVLAAMSIDEGEHDAEEFVIESPLFIPMVISGCCCCCSVACSTSATAAAAASSLTTGAVGSYDDGDVDTDELLILFF